MKTLLVRLVAAWLILLPSGGKAESVGRPTPNMSGVLGLNTVPNARLDPYGTVRLTLGRTTPYIHASSGFQIGENLYLGIRQTAKSGSLTATPDRLFPGMDMKYRLYPETGWRPEISLGLQSAFGQKRLAAEYLALSKKYENFDFTAGVGWGRMGSRYSIESPLTVGGAFQDKNRPLDGENPNSFRDWFRGDAGFFMGVQYFVPHSDWSLKADFSSDGWKAEKAADPSFKVPSPWSVGFDYQPTKWLSAGMALLGTDRLMARITVQGLVQNWPFTPASPLPALALLPNRSHNRPAQEISDTAQKNDLDLFDVRKNKNQVSAILDLQDTVSTPEQLGIAARHLSNLSGPSPETITIFPRYLGLKGPALSLNRRDIEQAISHHQGSAEEIWQTVFFNPNLPFQLPEKTRPIFRHLSLRFSLYNEISPAEEDNGILYRTALLTEIHKRLSRHFLSETSFRLNLSNNLSSLGELRPLVFLPVRGDIDQFSRHRLALERNYLSGFLSLSPNWHANATIGYLEEMYAGLGTEIIYRPWKKNWAVGFEISEALKRDPATAMSLGLTTDHILTGHLNAFYEIPNSDATLHASLGRYLAGDIGGSLSLTNRFRNGATLEGFVTATNQNDPDPYGGRTNVFSGLRIMVPLGDANYLPNGSRIETVLAPLGRNTGQKLDLPSRLYEATEPLSYRHITQHWTKVAKNQP